MKEFMRINYDDFYKFLVSSGIILILISVISIIYLDIKNLLDKLILILILICLLIFSMMIGHGLYNWNKRQKNHDTLLDLDVKGRKCKLRRDEIDLEIFELNMEEEKLNKKRTEVALKKHSAEKLPEEIEE